MVVPREKKFGTGGIPEAQHKDFLQKSSEEANTHPDDHIGSQVRKLLPGLREILQSGWEPDM